VGIVTNGFEKVQTRRLHGSVLAPHIHFMIVSEQCGFTKPDVRFFDHTMKTAGLFQKSRTLVIGDRLETDIAGAHAFGVDSCWFNPAQLSGHPTILPTYEIQQLSELYAIAGLGDTVHPNKVPGT
jgi:FMN phosphatase YigB (HAD superfamily)